MTVMNSTLTTHTFDDGATTTLEQWGERGPVVLCVHGMTSSRKAWFRLAKHLSDRFRVIAYDQRGHGDSAAITGPMSLERGVQDLQSVADSVGAQILVGHSWGGALAIRGGLRVAASAIAAIDPMIVQVDDRWYAEYIEELEETFALHGEARDARIREDFAEWHPDDVAGKVHAVHAMTTAPIAGLRDANRDGRWDLRAEIATYPKPLLLVMAGRDGSIVPGAVIDEVAAHHSSSVKIVTFEDQGHNLYRTAFERFASALDEFLAEH
jgi:pimeloyl-ACP methyl ester carboxylesterase